MLQLSCADAGFNCDKTFLAKTESELNEQMRIHAGEVHGVEPSDFSQQMTRELKDKIRRV